MRHPAAARAQLQLRDHFAQPYHDSGGGRTVRLRAHLRTRCACAGAGFYAPLVTFSYRTQADRQTDYYRSSSAITTPGRRTRDMIAHFLRRAAASRCAACRSSAPASGPAGFCRDDLTSSGAHYSPAAGWRRARRQLRHRTDRRPLGVCDAAPASSAPPARLRASTNRPPCISRAASPSGLASRRVRSDTNNNTPYPRATPTAMLLPATTTATTTRTIHRAHTRHSPQPHQRMRAAAACTPPSRRTAEGRTRRRRHATVAGSWQAAARQ